MIYSVNYEELAGRISHIDVAKYLHDIGWLEIPSKRELVKIFQMETQNDFYQIDLPVSRDLRDYSSAMYRAMERISESTQKSIEQVILEMLNPMADILRLRIYEQSNLAGSIFMEDAIKLYDNAKKLLMATAMDVVRPQLYHVGRTENSIVEFVNNCRFGQTEIGSYVVSIVCPISKIDNNQVVQLSFFSDEEEGAQSFTRKVVNKLVTSASLVKEAINQGVLESTMSQNAETENSFSVNFLDALSGINIYRSDSSLDISVKYAPTIRSNTLPNAAVTLTHDYYTPIDTMIKRVKRVQENEKTYIGRIKLLDAAPDPSVRKTGRVTLVFLNDAQNKATASVILSKDDYNDAIDAHQNGKTVKVVGTISGQTHRKIECTHFEVLG